MQQIAQNKVAERYAVALLKEAMISGVEQTILDDANSFISVCKKNREFLLIIKSPVVRAERKRSIIEKVFGDQLHPTTMNFINILLEHKRDMLMAEILTKFINLYKTKNGIIEAEVISAVQLDEKLIKHFTEKVKKLTGCKEVELTNTINMNILGGFKLKYQDKMIDMSLITKLSRLKKHLSN